MAKNPAPLAAHAGAAALDSFWIAAIGGISAGVAASVLTCPVCCCSFCVCLCNNCVLLVGGIVAALCVLGEALRALSRTDNGFLQRQNFLFVCFSVFLFSVLFVWRFLWYSIVSVVESPRLTPRAVLCAARRCENAHASASRRPSTRETCLSWTRFVSLLFF